MTKARDLANLSVEEFSVVKNDQDEGATFRIVNSFNGGGWAASDKIGEVTFETRDVSTTQPVRGMLRVYETTAAGTTYPNINALSLFIAFNNDLIERMRLSHDGVELFYTDALKVPVGTTAQRPGGAQGKLRYNATTASFEGYTTEWIKLSNNTATPTVASSSANTITVTNMSSYQSPSFRLKRGSDLLTHTLSGSTITITGGAGANTGSQTISVEAQDWGLTGSNVATVTVNIT